MQKQQQQEEKTGGDLETSRIATVTVLSGEAGTGLDAAVAGILAAGLSSSLLKCFSIGWDWDWDWDAIGLHGR
jgi:hypothetical protein